jgi:biopolymer transport protein ExbB
VTRRSLFANVRDRLGEASPLPWYSGGGLWWGLSRLQVTSTTARDRAPTLTLPRSTRGGKKLTQVFVTGCASLLLASAAFAQGVGSPAAATQPATTTNIPLIDLFFKGGIFMYPLAGCSILAVAIIFERMLSLRRSQVIPKNFMKGLRGVWRDPQADRQRALDYCRQKDSPIARMLAAGIKRMPRGIAVAEKAIEDAGANEALKLRRNMRFLYAIGSVATLLGLIGTIYGMIKAFEAAAAEGVGRINELSTGIYLAMVNTFSGLAVAIVVTIFYYFLIGRIERLISELNDELTDFSDQFGFNAESDRELRTTSTL